MPPATGHLLMGKTKTELTTEGVPDELIHGDCTCCNRPMRKRGVPLSDAPGTMAYGQRGLCKSCAQPSNLLYVRKSAEEGDERIDKVVHGLNNYFARGRYKRGIPPEPSPIAWKPSHQRLALTGAP